LVADAVGSAHAIAVAAGRHSAAPFSRAEFHGGRLDMQSERLDVLVEMREDNPQLHADHSIEEALEGLPSASRATRA
jgi:hypothetical protein